MGAKRPRVKIEAKRLGGGGKDLGGNVLGAKGLVAGRLVEVSAISDSYHGGFVPGGFAPGLGGFVPLEVSSWEVLSHIYVYTGNF